MPWSHKWQVHLFLLGPPSVWDPGGRLRHEEEENSSPRETTKEEKVSGRRSSKLCKEEFIRETLLWCCRTFGTNASWYQPPFEEEKEPLCFLRGEERPQPLDEEEVPTRRPRWGKEQRRPRGLVEGLIITSPTHGCV